MSDKSESARKPRVDGVRTRALNAVLGATLAESARNPRASKIEKIGVKGYKSIRSEQFIDIRPLTLLAGPNSSGKSSIMQSVLLLKQTLESAYDPGPLLLDGPNAKFSKASQLFFKGKGSGDRFFNVTIDLTDIYCKMHFVLDRKLGIQLPQMDWGIGEETLNLTPSMTTDEIKAAITTGLFKGAFAASVAVLYLIMNSERVELSIIRNRCYLEMIASDFIVIQTSNISKVLQSIIHVPGLRGNPTRSYPISAVGETFPGTFENYTASVLAKWEDEKSDNLDLVGRHLAELGLTWKIKARKVDDTKVELQVGRTIKSARGGASDMVNVADIGFGVSQTLPVLVALAAAHPGQLVYLEQPEIHLHPRAQVAMAKVLVNAANRGVQVVAETHSSLLLRGVQTLVANGEIKPEKVKLHWFSRDDEGETHITSADVDENGAFGDWPQDFDDVSLDTEGAYLDSVQRKIF